MKSKANVGLQYFLDLFLLAKRGENVSPLTLRTYRQRVGRFMAALEAIGVKDLAAIRAPHVQTFLGGLYANKTQSSTAAAYYRALHSFFVWALQEGLVASNPMDTMKAPKVERKIVQALTPAQIGGVLAGFDDKTFTGARNRAMLLLFLDTGLRLSEMLGIQLDDVSEESVKVSGKGAKERVVRFGRRTAAAFLKYQRQRHDAAPWLWVQVDGTRLSRNAVRLLFRRLGADLKKDGVKASPHIWRHSFAISYLRNGGDVFTLQRLLGHSTLAMTQRYLRSLSDADAMAAHRKFSPVDNMELG